MALLLCSGMLTSLLANPVLPSNMSHPIGVDLGSAAPDTAVSSTLPAPAPIIIRPSVTSAVTRIHPAPGVGGGASTPYRSFRDMRIDGDGTGVSNRLYEQFCTIPITWIADLDTPWNKYFRNVRSLSKDPKWSDKTLGESEYFQEGQDVQQFLKAALQSHPTSGLEQDLLHDLKLYMQHIQDDLFMLDKLVDNILIPKVIEARCEPRDAMVRRISAEVWGRGVKDYLAKIGGAGHV